MAVRYVLHDGELVSEQWKAALVAMEKRSGPNNVNEGHRTLARQQFFWDCFQCQCCNNGNRAAPPTPDAPHILEGRFWHAIDFADGPRAERDLEALGISAWRTVGGEPWHTEVDGGDLQRFHERHDQKPWETLPRHIVRRVRSFLSAKKMVRSRIADRDSIDSKAHPVMWERRNRRVVAAVEERAKHRRALEALRKRAVRPRTRRILREVLDND